MRILGITGGVGSGKSKVLNHLEEQYHAYVCQLDEVAKVLQRKGNPCYEKIVSEFGTQILGEDKELDRKKLGEIVFVDDQQRRRLNQIVHPEVKNWVCKDIQEKAKEKIPLYVIEAALFPGAGYESICEEFWYIYAEESVRRQRLKESRGYSDEKITNMISAQSSEEVFRDLCHRVIDNSGDFERTKKQIGELL